ncbi:hypothetical protein GCM10009678_13770 [Actinomadura kijaniata]
MLEAVTDRSHGVERGAHPDVPGGIPGVDGVRPERDGTDQADNAADREASEELPGSPIHRCATYSRVTWWR